MAEALFRWAGGDQLGRSCGRTGELEYSILLSM